MRDALERLVSGRGVELALTVLVVPLFPFVIRSLSLAWREWAYRKTILETERARRETHVALERERRAALADAARVIVTLEYQDGHREDVAQRPIPQSPTARRELEEALDNLETA
jgi:hypothetical protein